MNRILLPTIAALAALTVPASAQTYQRRANVGNGDPNSGKCTIEVVVDGAAEVEINGDNATLRNLSGQPAQWRRFECTSRMPANVANFRFQGIDGRGDVQLVRDPRNGGAAVVRIEDKDGGQEGYTFDIMWGRGNFDGGFDDRRSQVPNQPRYGQPGYRDGQPGYRGGSDIDIFAGIWGGGQRAKDNAVRVCREEITRRARTQFGPARVNFQNMRLEDNPDRRDWVMGRFMLRGRPHEFACSVNFQNGTVRWAQIDPEGGRWSFGDRADRVYGGNEAAFQNCRTEVMSRVRQRGLNNIQLGRVEIDNNPGRNDWIIGDVRGNRGPIGESFTFACRVNMNNGNVRSVDLTRR